MLNSDFVNVNNPFFHLCLSDDDNDNHHGGNQLLQFADITITLLSEQGLSIQWPCILLFFQP
jgi:hypothetical protein